MYFALGQELFDVNVHDLRVEHDEAYQLVNVLGLPRPPSARYLVPWDLPSTYGEGKTARVLYLSLLFSHCVFVISFGVLDK